MEARRCATHGLVVGDDGKCVICKRGEIATRAKTSSDLPVVILVVAMAVITLGALGYWATRRLSNMGADGGQPQAQPEAVPSEAAPPPPEQGGSEPPPRRTDDFPSISTSEPTATADPEELSTEELERQKRTVPITMYARPNCGLCDSARTFLSSRRYKLQELDVEASPTDKVVLQSLNPAGTMPTFVVDGKTIVGYDKRVLDDAIAAAANRKLKKN